MPSLIRAGQSDIPPPEQDPFVGQWRANVTQSKPKPKLNKTGASYERTVKRDGDDLIFASSGGASQAAIRDFRIRCDGTFHRLPVGSLLSCRYVGASRVEGETKGRNGDHSFWTREVSAKGQEMKISEYKDRARTKLRSLWVMDRVQ
ncbi:MAG: hypothetical protein WDO73_09025 [Ignavibacteriota bacterium]